VGQHGSASGSLLLDLDGLEVVSAELAAGRMAAGPPDDGENDRLCGLWMRAALHGRRLVRVRDLPIGGRPWCCAGISGSGAVANGARNSGSSSRASTWANSAGRQRIPAGKIVSHSDGWGLVVPSNLPPIPCGTTDRADSLVIQPCPATQAQPRSCCWSDACLTARSSARSN
jgi:hypothetical protein